MQEPTTERGVILIEAIVAITVLIFMVTGTLNLLARSIGGIRHANDRLVATYLAQDALEWVIAKREHNRTLPADRWRDGLPDGSTGAYGVETRASVDMGSLDQCHLLNTCVLRANAQGVYEHQAGGAVTPYTRTVSVVPTPLGERARVTVTVSWRNSGGEDSVSLNYTLYQ